MTHRVLPMAAATLAAALLATAAQAANFVSNPGFEEPSTGATSGFYAGLGGPSAAPSWPLYNNTFEATYTEVLASTAPGGEAQMLHIATDGSGNGVYQLFGGLAQYASVQVKVLSGVVALYLYSGSGTLQQGATFSTSATGWQTLSLNTGGANSNEIVVYSYGGGANFYVDNAYASNVAAPSSGAPEPTAWAMMIVGLGAAGSVMRRRRRLLAAG